MDFNSDAKTKLLSIVVSNKTFTKGHRDRLEFCLKLKERLGDKVDLFGNTEKKTTNNEEENRFSDMSKAAFDETFVNATQNIAQFCYKMIEKPPLKVFGASFKNSSPFLSRSIT